MDINQLVDQLTADLPQTSLELATLREEWAEKPPITLLFSVIGSGYVQAAHDLEPDAVRNFFSRIEDALECPQSDIRDAVATGLLEAIVNDLVRTGGDRTATLDAHAGPAALRYLRAWDEFSNTPR